MDFWQVSVCNSDGEFSLQLQDIDTQQLWSLPIPYQERSFVSTVLASPPPQILLDWIGTLTGAEQQAMVEMRAKILSFDDKITEEVLGKNTIRYGRGKSRPIAEIYFQRKTSRPIVFLWLPIPTPTSLFPLQTRVLIGRMRLWSDESGITHVGHIPEGLGKMKLQLEWEAMPLEKRPTINSSYSSKSMTPVQTRVYQNLVQRSECLGDLTTLALTMWRGK